MSLVKRHPIITFFVLSYAISWAFLPIESVRFLPSGPLFAALIVIPITQDLSGLKELGLRIIRWRVRWYWYAAAIGVPLAVHLAVVGLNVAAGAGVPSLTFSLKEVSGRCFEELQRCRALERWGVRHIYDHIGTVEGFGQALDSERVDA